MKVWWGMGVESKINLLEKKRVNNLNCQKQMTKLVSLFYL